MDLQERISALGAAPDLGDAVATVTLDVSGSGILPREAAVFLRDRVYSRLERVERAAESDQLRRAAAHIRDYISSSLKPETEGLYLAAGAEGLEAMELRVPLRNSVQVESSPCIAPLVEAGQRWPRSLYVRFDDRRADIMEFDLGILAEVATHVSGHPDSDVERSAVGAAAVRHGMRLSGSGVGGDRRDRFQQSMNAGVEGMLRQAARSILARRGDGASPIFIEGKPRRHDALVRHLTKGARADIHLLPATGRKGEPALRRIMTALEKRHEEAVELQVLELQSHRAEGGRFVLGPEGMAQALTEGRLARLFVTADHPAPGVRCSNCAGLFAGSQTRCTNCGGAVRRVSLREEALRRSLGGRTFDVTFVGASKGWLTELGGMAALLKR